MNFDQAVDIITNHLNGSTYQVHGYCLPEELDCLVRNFGFCKARQIMETLTSDLLSQCQFTGDVSQFSMLQLAQLADSYNDFDTFSTLLKEFTS